MTVGWVLLSSGVGAGLGVLSGAFAPGLLLVVIAAAAFVVHRIWRQGW